MGPYRLDALLGEGAMGVVYRARRLDDGSLVALKVLRPTLIDSDTYRQRFVREAQIAQDVRHQRLVPVVDAGEAGHVMYLAMEHVDGSSLDDVLAAEGRLDVPRTLAAIADVASGLDALHARGLVHRDVKPSNILIDGDGHALLTDFGLARGPAHTVLTRPGQLIGTPHYLAPEVITGGSAEPVSDVYALGCVAYACLVGEPPFPRNNVFEVTIAHLEDEPPDPATLGIELGASVSIALRTALAKTPSERPASARAYALALWRAAAPSGRT